jgi:hypothetical protein
MKHVPDPEFEIVKLMVCMIASPIAAATIVAIVYWPGWWV